jgi:hypothetical protein
MAESLGGPRREDVEALTLGYLVVFPSLPTASATNRGRMAIVYGGEGVADTVKVCLRQADGSYAWAVVA